MTLVPEATIRLLQARGHRMTTARRFMIQTLHDMKTPASAADLLKALKKHRIEANRTTIYRELDFLSQNDIVKVVDFGDGIRRYEYAHGPHHHHFVCTQCKAVMDINLKNDLDTEERLLEKLHGIAIASHSLEFFGKCKNCK